jgi:hypothetical protein
MKWFVVLFLLAGSALAFDYEGHRLINELALQALPTNFPSFVQTPVARERILYLGGEPDRWRNTREFHLRHLNNPDHYFDFEDLGPLGITVEKLSPFRYEFMTQLANARAANPQRFPAIDPRDAERVRHLPGFAPWSIAEHYAKLQSGFSTLKTFREMGIAEEIANAEQSVIYAMGMLSHFVADAAQPLHSTRHFNGWTGPNTNGFTTNKNFHAWIDGEFLEKVGLPTAAELQSHVRPARRLWTDSSGVNSKIFPVAAQFMYAQHELVVPLYELEKAGKLIATAARDGEGRTFVCTQLAAGAVMLADLWLTAWETAPPDTFLQGYLAKRKLKAN